MDLLGGAEIHSRTPLPLVAQCGACGLHRTCRTPKMPVHGRGLRGIMVVGPSPSKADDESGVPLSGPAGKYLRNALARNGVDLDRDCYTTFSRICRPSDKAKGAKNYKTLMAETLRHCRPNLMHAVRDLNPTTIILVGIDAVTSLIGWDWKESVGEMSRWAGWTIPDQRRNAWICPVADPKDILRLGKGVQDVAGLWFDRHIAAAVELDSRPWNRPPNWKRKLIVEVSPVAAADILQRLKGPVAFDYETDRVKPDHPDARIMTASMSDGKTTVSFPWHGDAIDAAKDVLFSDVPKIAHNAKFEQRWTRRILRKRVNNLAWCTMQAAHMIDNRPGIVGLKFQAYVRLGAESYDDTLKPYMDGKGGNTPNRLHKADLRQLLEYGGLDSLYTWKLAALQRQELGYKEW